MSFSDKILRQKQNSLNSDKSGCNKQHAIIAFLCGNMKYLIIYCIIGCSGAGLDFLLYTALLCMTSWNYQCINILSTSCGIINNFFLNSTFNFKTKDHLLFRLFLFYTIGLFGLGITAVLLHLLIECFLYNKIIAKGITICAVTAIQFLLNRFITFKQIKNNTSPQIK